MPIVPDSLHDNMSRIFLKRAIVFAVHEISPFYGILAFIMIASKYPAHAAHFGDCLSFFRPHNLETGSISCVRWYDKVPLGNRVVFITLFHYLMKETAKREERYYVQIISQNIDDTTDISLHT
jgi:hypothetical protein